MKVIVLGANGRTGRLVVQRAIAKGYKVSVLVRNAARSYPPGVRVIEGDALAADDVMRAIDGQDAVLQCIGGNAPWKYQTLERDAMRNIVAAMQKSEARRLVVVSAMGVGESAQQSPWWYRWFVVPTFLRGIIADKNAMEAIVRASKLDWVIARAPILEDGATMGTVHVLRRSQIGHAITRADLAVWLVQQLEGRAYLGQAVVMAN